MKDKSNFTGKFKSLINFLKTQKGIGLSLVLFALVFNVVFLRSEVTISTYSLNDEVLHLTTTQEASSALRQNLNPTDFWLPQIGLGFPLFHYYQHLPHLVLAGLNQLTSFFLPLPRLFDISRYLLLVLFPLSIFLAMRRLDFDYLAAGFSSLIASLLSTNNLYGFDYGSYLWRGDGLYTQLWAMFFLPLALVEIYRTVRKEGSWFWPVFLSAIVLLSNLLYGYILILSAILLVFLKLSKTEILSRLKKSTIIFILTILITAYFFIPFILDQNYLNRSIWEESFKYDSFGALAVLKNLFTGNLLDYGRLPVLTIFFFGAVILAIKQWKKENYHFLLLLTIFWFILYFGRPTWGLLLNLLPFSQDLHFHRFIGGFHLGAIMLIGAGLSLFWQRIKGYFFKFPKYILPVLTGVILITFLFPVLFERGKYYQQNAQWKAESQDAIALKSNEILEIKKTLESLPPGRVYAGLAADFGKAPYYKIGSVPLYAILPQLGLDSFGYAFYAFPLSTDVRLHFDNTKSEQYNLFNIRYVILHKTWTAPNYYSKIKEFDDYVLYQIPTTGYFDLVDVPAVFYGDKKDFYYPNYKWLVSSLPQDKQHPILEIGDKPTNTFGLLVFAFQKVDEKVLSGLVKTPTIAGKILGEKVDTNKYWVQFDAERDSYLMLKTNYHPGWRATLDSEKITPVMLAPGFIGIKVTPGVHQALFSYESSFIRLPFFVFGVIILLALSFYRWKRYKKNLIQQLGLRTVWKKYRNMLSQWEPKTKDINLKKIINIAIITRLAILLVIILAYFILPFNIRSYNSHRVLNEGVNIFSVFKTWDSQHYLLLAENGYSKVTTMSTAFYPFYPFIIKSIGFLFLGNTLLAGLLFSNICSILAVVYFYLFVKKLYNDKVAFTASIFMMSFITFFYTSLVYSEGLFILLVIAFFYYLYGKNFKSCLFTTILIPLTRPIGILVILALVTYLIIDMWNFKKVKITKSYILLLGFMVGLLMYLGIMKYMTSSFFSGFDAQNLFISKFSISNLFHPLQWFQRNFLNIHYTFNGYTTSILNRVFFSFFLILLYYIYKYLDKTLFIFSLTLGLAPALAGNFMSYIRLLLVVFPIYIVLSLKFQKNPYLIIIPSTALQILLLIAHGLHYWVA